jgi:hypothetical protein
MAYLKFGLVLAAALMAAASAQGQERGQGRAPIADPATYPNFDSHIVCMPTVAKKLSDFGVARENVREMLAERHFSAAEFGDVYLGWTVWVDLKSCDGSLAIRVSEECGFVTAYTTGKCRIPGVYPSD